MPLVRLAWVSATATMGKYRAGMEIARVILRCVDLERAVQFWRDAVGLELVRQSEGFAFFAAGSTELILSEVPPEHMVASLTEVVFSVDDVLETHRRLGQRGVPFEVEPRPVLTEGNRHLLATHFRDPDGDLASVTGWVEAS